MLVGPGLALLPLSGPLEQDLSRAPRHLPVRQGGRSMVAYIYTCTSPSTSPPPVSGFLALPNEGSSTVKSVGSSPSKATMYKLCVLQQVH